MPATGQLETFGSDAKNIPNGSKQALKTGLLVASLGLWEDNHAADAANLATGTVERSSSLFDEWTDIKLLPNRGISGWERREARWSACDSSSLR